MLSYLDYLVFLHAVFCTEQLYAFRRIIFSMFLRKKKLKITCPFCMGYRLTKMRRLFYGGFFSRNIPMILNEGALEPTFDSAGH